ncbi:SDR family NAD(P)-dependent oxidoreductase [Streptomyces albidus (ex Kaewkla and Franco 2022)]|uniref:SDR family NAD(P)-dependent oxidoreductase n=1 Tax=Streptomyces albidus (ex Kaewkla and Franco 2022) TaxID=722709 RepID=UPI0015EE9FEA|nr:SDR family oxidoreductase [Streptomyces albidus (ex Kaewkla and Franco 2022)]
MDTALVTGGGSGIGRATAVALAARGTKVVVAGRQEHTLIETAKMIEESGGTASHVLADIALAEGAARAVGTVTERYGRLDLAVNCAGLPSWGLTADMAPAEWEQVMGVNVNGTWLCMKYEIEQMLGQGGGAIVNVSSRIGPHMRVTHQSAYAASKSALSTLTRSAAREYIGRGIRINAVSPGPTDTAMAVWPGETAADRDARVARDIPAGRLARPEEIAGAVLWLASPGAAFVVGHDLVIDGGLSA